MNLLTFRAENPNTDRVVSSPQIFRLILTVDNFETGIFEESLVGGESAKLLSIWYYFIFWLWYHLILDNQIWLPLWDFISSGGIKEWGKLLQVTNDDIVSQVSNAVPEDDAIELLRCIIFLHAYSTHHFNIVVLPSQIVGLAVSLRALVKKIDVLESI